MWCEPWVQASPVLSSPFQSIEKAYMIASFCGFRVVFVVEMMSVKGDRFGKKTIVCIIYYQFDISCFHAVCCIDFNEEWSMNVIPIFYNRMVICIVKWRSFDTFLSMIKCGIRYRFVYVFFVFSWYIQVDGFISYW